MDDELLTWLKSFDIRMTNIEKSVLIINHELGVLSGKTQNGKVNPTVNLIVRYIAFPLIVILGSLYGVTTVFGG